MKSRNINIVLFLSIVSALYLFYFKFQQTPPAIDKIGQGLNGIHSYIRPETVIGLKTPTNDLELQINMAYLLAPVPLYFGVLDTTLFLIPLNTTDTVLSLLKQKTIIWQNKDDKYQYILARTP